MDSGSPYTVVRGTGENNLTTVIDPPTVNKKKKDNYVWDFSCCECAGYLTGILIELTTLIFGILFIVLSAVGGENISNRDCHCTLFTRSLGHGLGISLLLEIGMLFAVLVMAIGLSLCQNSEKEEACTKLVQYYCYVTGSFIALNYIAFLCMTIAVLVFVATGGSCCSATSVAVASLSAVMAVFKFIVILVVLCYSYFSGDS